MSFTDIDPPRGVRGFGPEHGSGSRGFRYSANRRERDRETELDRDEANSDANSRGRFGWSDDASSQDHRHGAHDTGHPSGHHPSDHGHHERFYRSGWQFGSRSYRQREGFSIRRNLLRAEAWLDERGRGAWIAAMVLGFIFFWPVGLALLAYAIWSKRMFKSLCGHRNSHHHGMSRGFGMRSSGNSAFDSYRADTLRRLEEEQEAFESFLERLRAAKDKQEFDSFMDERVARARAEAERRSAEGSSEPQPSA